MTKKNARTSGFTLVELSIVLVIIGLIIGGVLGGRQLMMNAQITNAVNAIQAYEAQFQSYIQNYGVMPGDDKNAVSRFSSATMPASLGDSDGTLEGAYDSTTESDETALLWADLRAAGLVKGTAGDTSLPVNPFGGKYGFQHGAFSGTPLFTTNVICMNNVPGDAAMAIDSRLDDGNSNSGAVLAGESVTGEVADSYVETTNYIVCVKM